MHPLDWKRFHKSHHTWYRDRCKDKFRNGKLTFVFGLEFLLKILHFEIDLLVSFLAFFWVQGGKAWIMMRFFIFLFILLSYQRIFRVIRDSWARENMMNTMTAVSGREWWTTLTDFGANGHHMIGDRLAVIQHHSFHRPIQHSNLHSPKLLSIFQHVLRQKDTLLECNTQSRYGN